MLMLQILLPLISMLDSFYKQNWSGGPVLAAKIGPPWLNLVAPGPVLVAKIGPRDQFWLLNLVWRTIFNAVSAERCPYGKDGVPHPSICVYVCISVRCEILVINIHISRAKSAALSVYRHTCF